MKLKKAIALSAICTAGIFSLVGCEADDSAPTRPRQPLFLQENDNTDKRKAEPVPLNPATPPKEFPGAGSQGPDFGKSVISAMGGIIRPVAPREGDPMPHLHTLPRDHYAEGEVAVPDTDLTIDNSWGQGLPVEKPLHRDWQKKTVSYQNGTANHNPTYFKPLEQSSRRLAFFSVQDSLATNTLPLSSVKLISIPADPNDTAAFVEQLRYTQNGTTNQFDIGGLGTKMMNTPEAQLNRSIVNQSGFSGTYPQSSVVLGYIGGTAVDAVWMVWESITLPIAMFKQPPWTHVQTFVSPLPSDGDPAYLGAMPEGGPIAPSPYPGEVQWKYPWTRPLGEQQNTGSEVPELTPENSKDLRIKPKP